MKNIFYHSIQERMRSLAHDQSSSNHSSISTTFTMCQQCSCVSFKFTSLPPELIQLTLSFLPNSQLKSVSIVSKQLQANSRQVLWYAPLFKERLHPAQLPQLSGMPIRTLYLSSFLNLFDIVEIEDDTDGYDLLVQHVEAMPGLTDFVIGNHPQRSESKTK